MNIRNTCTYKLRNDTKNRVVAELESGLKGVASIKHSFFDVGIFTIEMVIDGWRNGSARIETGAMGLFFSVDTGLPRIDARRKTLLKPDANFWRLLEIDASSIKGFATIIKELVTKAAQKAQESGITQR